eukprot:13140125-Alexandrium_andersonii.AAC.1
MCIRDSPSCLSGSRLLPSLRASYLRTCRALALRHPPTLAPGRGAAGGAGGGGRARGGLEGRADV